MESNNEEGHVEPEAEGDKSDVGPCREVYPCEPCDKLELQVSKFEGGGSKMTTNFWETSKVSLFIN